jgi:hypothetical protein
VKHQVFISYPDPNVVLVENLAGQLKDFGIAAWVFSINKTLAEGSWGEIEAKIHESEVFLFVASQFSKDAKGQHRELSVALEKIRTVKPNMRACPIVIDDVDFRSLPDGLAPINGERLSGFTVKSTAFAIAKTFFPDVLEMYRSQEWKCPRPGQWLEVCRIDSWIEEYFDLGDLMYFRRLSPLGLFECYSPRLDGLFWFAPQNLKMSDIVDEGGSLERENVPRRYHYDMSFEAERLGFEELEKKRL